DPPSEADTSQPTAVAAPPLADTSQPTDVAAPPVADVAPAPAPAGGDTAAAGEAPSGDEAPKSANLPTIIPLLVDPSANAPPIFAESWGGDAPANPFSDVSDGAIEYFVEWSLEQSIGPRALPQAQFSDIPMALPGTTGSHAAYDPASRRRRLVQFGAVFAAGALAGAVVVALVKRSPAAAPAPVAAIAAPPSAETAAAPTPARPAAAGAPADAELVVITRPSGAAVTIDGEPAGNTPLTTHVSAGQHAVAFTKERYAFATANVDAPGKLTFDLHRPSATLHVSSTPPAADVVIAGEHRGKTPVDIKLPGFESYDVRVLVAGGKPWRKTVYLSHASNRVDAALAVNKPPPPRSGRR
ncbi:MAG: PEGA domain-containing protein, partial [Polyangia bacterium]